HSQVKICSLNNYGKPRYEYMMNSSNIKDKLSDLGVYLLICKLDYRYDQSIESQFSIGEQGWNLLT
ncbi:hypothetical protein, partial [Cylindrospermopsis raciborskii]|uniref:hypothetical protein n=1 Tax=Cylindrospermopsis raciborskii TaxID=77022 RepID=UPI001CA5965F